MNNKKLNSILKKKGLLFDEDEEDDKKNKNGGINSQNYGIRIYDLETKKNLEEIIKESKLKVKYNKEAKNYTQLIDEFEMPNTTNCLALTDDENYIWAAGVIYILFN
jgi:hypothetical protein